MRIVPLGVGRAVAVARRRMPGISTGAAGGVSLGTPGFSSPFHLSAGKLELNRLYYAHAKNTGAHDRGGFGIVSARRSTILSLTVRRSLS